ncbi:MAG TPA: hypothetical protein VF017_17810 [Thermoanaerobaculia bacterium]|nr:hypothetical protein [Thermoanaerobaculia bacterium]
MTPPRRSGPFGLHGPSFLFFTFALCGALGCAGFDEPAALAVLDETLTEGDVERLAAAARAARGSAGEPAGKPGGGKGRRLVAVSLGRERSAARVALGRGETVDGALAAALADLLGRVPLAERSQGPLRVDVLSRVTAEERIPESRNLPIERGVEGVYLREIGLVLLPDELAARGLVNNKNRLQNGRLRSYFEAGSRAEPIPGGELGEAGEPFQRLRFESFAVHLDGKFVRLFRGNPLAPEVSPEGLLLAAREGGDYLIRHQREDGEFAYEYDPSADKVSSDYNLLRHAGSCYALFELHAATGDARYLAAGRKGLDALWRHLRGPRPEDAGERFQAVVSPGEEAKLGGAALALLALLQEREVAPAPIPPLAVELARFLVFMQDADGHFRSKYFYGEPDPRPFESIYYPGEAILALARLSDVDTDPRWLATARKGADWLIEVRDRGKKVEDLPHDHWLLMGLEELHAKTGDGRYLEQARRIAQAILGAQWGSDAPWPDWQGGFYRPPRSTPTATRAEGMVAMTRLAERAGLDTVAYRRCLRDMAVFQLRTRLGPEALLFVARPDLARGGFRAGLTQDEVRIDYVQHNVSALLGLRGLLLSAPDAAGSPRP